LECVPLLSEGVFTDVETFMNLMDNTSILGGSKIEGVVIKNYQRYGRDGKCLMGKFVSEKFKEIHQGSWRKKNPGGKDIIQLIIEELRTPARWNKAIQRLRDGDCTYEYTQSPKDIGPLLKLINYDILEECKEIIQEKLFKWAWRNISRGITRGFAEYYKEELTKKQFNNYLGE